MNSFKYEEIISNVFSLQQIFRIRKEQISLPKEFKYMELTIKLMKNSLMT